MKLIRSLALMLACLFFSSATISKPNFDAPHLTTFQLSMDGDSTCSSTAIGPHALLTAEHCIDGIKTIKVAGVPVRVLHIDKDGDDHVILIVDRKFDHWARFRDREARVGDTIFIFGNPGIFQDLLRVGIVSGYATFPQDSLDDGPKIADHDVTLYDFNGFYGDSGSAVFNENGMIVAVVSLVVQQASQETPWKMVASFPLLFAPEVIARDIRI